jgi:hypothetical protein
MLWLSPLVGMRLSFMEYVDTKMESCTAIELLRVQRSSQLYTFIAMKYAVTPLSDKCRWQ